MRPTYLMSLAPALGVLALVLAFRSPGPPREQPVPEKYCHILGDDSRIRPPHRDSAECVRDLSGRTHAELNHHHFGDLFGYAQTRP